MPVAKGLENSASWRVKSRRYSSPFINSKKMRKIQNLFFTAKVVREGNDLKQIMDNCQITLDEVQSFVDKHSSLEDSIDSNHPAGVIRRVWHSYQVGTTDLEDTRGKLTFYTSTIDLFLNSPQTVSLARIEHMVYELYKKQIMAPQESTVSVASISSIHSLIDNESDKTAWRVLRGELLAVGVSDSDIENHKIQIISYIKGLITDGLSTSELMGEATQNDISQRRTLLSNLDLYSMHHQKLGKAEISFRIDRLQYGQYQSLPACLVVIDVSLRWQPGYELTALYFFMNVTRSSTGGSKPGMALEDPPHLLEWSPKNLSLGLVNTTLREIGTTVEAEVPLLRPLVGQSTKSWNTVSYQCRLESFERSNGRTVEWRVLGDSDLGTGIPQAMKLAVIIEHANMPFVMEIERSATLRSTLRRLTTFGVRNKIERIPITPENSNESLDDIDLETFSSVIRDQYVG